MKKMVCALATLMALAPSVLRTADYTAPIPANPPSASTDLGTVIRTELQNFIPILKKTINEEVAAALQRIEAAKETRTARDELYRLEKAKEPLMKLIESKVYTLGHTTTSSFSKRLKEATTMKEINDLQNDLQMLEKILQGS